MRTSDYNLQILHHEEVFETRELALSYLVDYYKPNSIDAEPILVKYGNVANPDVILAFGTSNNAPGSFYAIDMTKANVQIEELIEQSEQSAEEFGKLSARLFEIVNASGLDFDNNKITNKITYKPDVNDEVISAATTIAQAIDLLSKYVQQNFTDNELSVENTKSINLTLANNPNGGKSLKADVNISEIDNDNVDFNNNIIGIKSDGIYAASHLAYDDARHQLIFTTSGVKNGRFQDDAIIERIDLGEHTKLLADNDGKTIRLSVNENTANYTTTISAEAELSSNEDNILEKRDGKLAVLGRSSNIKYENTTVENELTTHKNRIIQLENDVADAALTAHIEGGNTNTLETVVTSLADGGSKVTGSVKLSTNNSIIVSNGGLETNIAVDVDNVSNSLVVRIGNQTVTKQLPGVELFESAEYNDTNEELIITFRTGKTLVIPIHDIINTWSTLNETNSPVVLTKTVVTGGSDTLSGDIKLRSTDNLIGKENGYLFVSENVIDNKINTETVRATTAETSLQSTINTLSNDINAELSSLSDNISDVAESVVTERERALNVESVISGVANHADEIAQEAKGMAQDIQSNVTTLSTDLTTVETNLSNLTQAVTNNRTEVNTKFAETNANVAANASDISDLTADLADEVTARTNADTSLDGRITNLSISVAESVVTERERATTAETVLDGRITNLSTSLTSERERATTAETVLDGKITDLSTSLTSERERATTAETVLDGKITNLNQQLTAKANAVDVYTKAEIDNKGFLTEHQDISGLADKFTTDETNTVRMSMSNANVLTSDVKIKTLSGGETNIIKNDANGIYATVSLTYDAATNTLTFNEGNGNKQIHLTGATLLESAEYDNVNKLIILHVKNGSVSSDITIPVGDLVDTWVVQNNVSSPVVLTKTNDANGDVLSADLSILNNQNNLLVNQNGSLFVDADSNSHIALWGNETTSVQGVINILYHAFDDIENMKQDILDLKSEVEDLKEKIGDVNINERLTAIEETLDNLIDFGYTTNSEEPTPAP